MILSLEHQMTENNNDPHVVQALDIIQLRLKKFNCRQHLSTSYTEPTFHIDQLKAALNVLPSLTNAKISSSHGICCVINQVFPYVVLRVPRIL